MSHISEESKDLELFHYGVKGMKWGVRKKSESSNEGSSKPKVKKPPEESFSLKNPKVRAAAVIGVAVTGIVAGAFVSSHLSKSVSGLSSDTISKGADAVKKILDEPDDIMYMSKAYRGFKTGSSLDKTGNKFISKGNTKDFLEIFDRSGLEDMDVGSFKKQSNGDIAAVLNDFMGNVDSAGRPIAHLVLVPAKKAVGLNNLEEVIEKYGPDLQARYAKFIEDERNL